MPASCCACSRSSASAGMSSGRGPLTKRLFSRSIAMMSACLVIAQKGRYGALSTQATGSWARRLVSAVCSRASSLYAVGSASTCPSGLDLCCCVGVLIRRLLDLAMSTIDGRQDQCHVVTQVTPALWPTRGSSTLGRVPLGSSRRYLTALLAMILAVALVPGC